MGRGPLLFYNQIFLPPLAIDIHLCFLHTVEIDLLSLIEKRSGLDLGQRDQDPREDEPGFDPTNKFCVMIMAG
jgi:hypothetical protein